MKRAIRFLTSFVAMAFVFGIYWVGGGDFERSENLAWTLIYAICAWLLAYFAPHWED